MAGRRTAHHGLGQVGFDDNALWVYDAGARQSTLGPAPPGSRLMH
jgi:hypothetical protein